MSDADGKTTESTENKAEAPVAEQPAAAAAPAAVEEVPAATADAPADAPIAPEDNLFDPGKLNILNDVSILLTIEIGRAQIKIRDLLNLAKGSVIELNKLAGDPVDVYANGKLVSIGNIITANGKYCVRLTSIPDHGKNGANNDGK